MNTLRKIIQRFRSAGFLPTIKYLFFTVLLERLGIHFDVIFVYESSPFGQSQPGNYHCKVIGSLDGLAPSVREALVDYGGNEMIEDVAKSFAEKQLCVLGFIDGRFGGLGWFEPQGHDLFVDQEVYLMWRAFVLPDMRGQKLLPLTMIEACSFIRRDLRSNRPIVVECSLFNKSSRRGIENAGFELIAKEVEIGRWKTFYQVRDGISRPGGRKLH